MAKKSKHWYTRYCIPIDEEGNLAVNREKEISNGSKSVTTVSNGAEALSPTSIPCKYVIVMAPVDSSDEATNTKICRIGNASGQKRMLHYSDIDGILIPCNDVADVYILPGADGDGVDWVAYG